MAEIPAKPRNKRQALKKWRWVILAALVIVILFFMFYYPTPRTHSLG
jgi:hypothetical protein